MAPRLHLVDGTFELYRAHFSKRPAQVDRRGADVKATAGLLQSLQALLRDPTERVTHLAIAFDNPIRSFRNDLYAGYKSDEGVPPELRAQFDGAEAAARALGVTVWSMARHEADDALATAVARFSGGPLEVRVLSPDKDLAQCLVHPGVTLVDRIRKRETDRAAFRERKGFDAAGLADFLALAGDSADGFPGLPGFGDKTAAALIASFGRLEQIPDDARLWPRLRGVEKLAATLAAQRAQANLYKLLATLVTDVPLAEDLAQLSVPSPHDPALRATLEELGL